MTKVVLYGGHIYMVCISVPPCALAQEHFPPYNRTERLCGRACKSWYILNYRRINMNFNSLNFYNRNYELVRSLSLDNLLLKDMKDISSFDGSILYLEGKRIHKVELVSDDGRRQILSVYEFKKKLIDTVEGRNRLLWRKKLYGVGQTDEEMIKDIINESERQGSRGSHSEGGRKKGGDTWKRKKSTSQLYKELRGTWGED